MHGKVTVTESNQAVLSLFKELVLSQSMAVPVAAMNALVLKLKVGRRSYVVQSII
jgi:hypothetical protein